MATRRPPGAGRAEDGVSRAAILDALQAGGEPMTVQQLAERLRLHQNSVRFHLTRLVSAGSVREDRADPAGPGRPRLVYRPAEPGAAVASAGHGEGHELLAGALADHLARTAPSPAEDAVRAGEERGRRMVDAGDHRGGVSAETARAEVAALMERNGFEPEWDADGERLWLRHCPFRPLADEQPAVTCSVHLGLMRGALEALDAPIEVTALEYASAPYPCVALFADREGHPGGGPTGRRGSQRNATRRPTATRVEAPVGLPAVRPAGAGGPSAGRQPDGQCSDGC